MSHKILVIDDDHTFAQFLVLLLQDNGYETVVAHDGQEGLEKARSVGPDLILLDITMPEKSGVRFYRELRSDEDVKQIPVVMVTGVSIDFKQFIHSRRQVPAPEGYVPKPVDREVLLETIADILS